MRTIDWLGYRVRDRVTNIEGVVTSVCFDLYGCVQACIHPGVKADGDLNSVHWYDISRLVMIGDGDRVMNLPDFPGHRSELAGPSDKPSPPSS